MIPFLRTILLFITAFFVTFVLGLTVIIAGLFRVKGQAGRDLRQGAALVVVGRVVGNGDQGARPRTGKRVRRRAAHLRVQSRQLVRCPRSRQDPAALQVRRQGGAVQSSDLWPRDARGGDDRDPAREQEGGVRRLRRRRRANPGRQLGRRISGGHARARLSAPPVQEGPIRPRDRGGRSDRPDHRARHDRDHAQGLTLGSSGND